MCSLITVSRLILAASDVDRRHLSEIGATTEIAAAGMGMTEAGAEAGTGIETGTGIGTGGTEGGVDGIRDHLVLSHVRGIIHLIHTSPFPPRPQGSPLPL